MIVSWASHLRITELHTLQPVMAAPLVRWQVELYLSLETGALDPEQTVRS
jgi:hypothetical protein